MGYEGRPKMIWKPSVNTLILFIGLIVHYVSYVSGVIYGLVTKDEKEKVDDKENV
jgi:hypothetical protein